MLANNSASVPQLEALPGECAVKTPTLFQPPLALSLLPAVALRRNCITYRRQHVQWCRSNMFKAMLISRTLQHSAMLSYARAMPERCSAASPARPSEDFKAALSP